MVNSYTGYSEHLFRVADWFAGRGLEVVIRPSMIREQFGAAIPDRMVSMVSHDIQPDPWEVMINYPNARPTNGKRTVYFTMYEATRLPSMFVGYLNMCRAIIVPCSWNRDWFKKVGVRPGISICPLGIDTGTFKHTPMIMDGPTVFGAAGRLAHGIARKGVNDVIDAFRIAFPSDPNVRLRIKAFPDCKLIEYRDPRIEVVREMMPADRLAEWFSGLTCFCSMAKAEGWGLMQQQAMAVGRPVIASVYAGLAEFMNQNNSYPVTFREVRAVEKYRGHGKWAQPDQRHFISLMRKVHANRAEAAEIGARASADASKFTWDESCLKLESILAALNVI